MGNRKCLKLKGKSRSLELHVESTHASEQQEK